MTTAKVVVLTKDPVAGRVKTRLVPTLGASGAARLHWALAVETVRLAAATGLPVEVALAGDLHGDFASALRGLSATVVPQASGNLGDRLTHALAGPGRRVGLGSDCVVFEPEQLSAAAALTTTVGFGPSNDGGYWCVALDGTGGATATQRVFQDIPWSTPHTLTASIAAADAAGLSVQLLPESFDVDDGDDLAVLLAHPRCPASIVSLCRLLAADAGRGG